MRISIRTHTRRKISSGFWHCAQNWMIDLLNGTLYDSLVITSCCKAVCDYPACIENYLKLRLSNVRSSERTKVWIPLCMTDKSNMKQPIELLITALNLYNEYITKIFIYERFHPSMYRFNGSQNAESPGSCFHSVRKILMSLFWMPSPTFTFMKSKWSNTVTQFFLHVPLCHPVHRKLLGDPSVNFPAFDKESMFKERRIMVARLLLHSSSVRPAIF